MFQHRLLKRNRRGQGAVGQDAAAAALIVREDLEIDAKFQGIMRQLVTYMMEDPRTISTSLEIMFIAKAVERMGDHAKNTAEQVIYIVRGTDVRHVTIDQLEREAMGGSLGLGEEASY